jgi:hypothetical protein
MGTISVRLIAVVCIALVLVGIAVVAGIAFTPALATVAVFLSVLIVLVFGAARRFFKK